MDGREGARGPAGEPAVGKGADRGGATRAAAPARSRHPLAHRLALGLYTALGTVGQPLLRSRRRVYRDARMARERAGDLELPPAVEAAPRRIWLHGASVGEIRALPPIIAALRSVAPGAALVVSALTDTGLDAARRLDGIAAAFALPIDLPAPVGRALDRVEPDALLILETELWPRLLAACGARSIPVAILNGKLSARSGRAYRRLRPLFGPLLGTVAAVAAQSAADARRFAAIGVRGPAIEICGSSKIDVLPAAPAPRPAVPVAGRPVIVAGSIRAGEEGVLLDAWRRLGRAEPRPLLVLAPRHLDRCGRAGRAVARRGLKAVRRSLLGPELTVALREAAAGGADVLLLDTLGELADAYPLGLAAIVGGGLTAPGGHNLLEPAARGRPVVFGRHHLGVAGEDVALEAAGAGWRCAGAAALAAALAGLLGDPGAAWERGERAAAVVAGARGAAGRAVAFVAGRLGWTTVAPAGARSPC